MRIKLTMLNISHISLLKWNTIRFDKWTTESSSCDCSGLLHIKILPQILPLILFIEMNDLINCTVFLARSGSILFWSNLFPGKNQIYISPSLSFSQILLLLLLLNTPQGKKKKHIIRSQYTLLSYLYPSKQIEETSIRNQRKHSLPPSLPLSGAISDETPADPLAFRRLRKTWRRHHETMSVSYSDCFSDLLCGEDSSSLFGDCSSSSDVESPAGAGESIAGFIEGERDFMPGIDYVERFQSQPLEASARQESVSWILKVIIIIAQKKRRKNSPIQIRLYSF